MQMKELLIILAVVLVVFGARKLRSVGEDLGHAVRGFKRAISEEDQEENPNASTRRQIPSETPDAEISQANASPKADGGSRSERGA